MVIRLDKYLCDMQAGTRSAVKDIIRKKRVTINGEAKNNGGGNGNNGGNNKKNKNRIEFTF